MELPAKILNAKWNPDLIHQAVLAHLSASRQKLAHTKNRGEVRGGGRKPWRQKGTGRARHGSIRSPIWVGGGVTFGPRNEKNFSRKINRKMKHSALFAVLAKKFKDGEVKFVDSFNLKDSKTKTLNSSFKELLSKGAVLFISGDKDHEKLRLASRNLERASAMSPGSLNIYDVLKNKYLVFDKKSLDVLEKHYV